MNSLSNSTKVWLFLTLVSVLLMTAGYDAGGRLGLLLGFLLAVGFQALMYYHGETPLLDFFQARRLTGQDPWGLKKTVLRHIMPTQLQVPHIYLVETPAVIAFALAPKAGFGSICFSTGLLDKLSKEEIDAVVAHQICHISKLNSFPIGVAQVLAFSFLHLGLFLDQLWLPNYFRKTKQIPFSRILAVLSWLILRVCISDKLFFQNDAMAADLLKERHHLAEALWKLDGLCQSHPLRIPPCSQHFFIVNPTKDTASNKFFFAHPRIEIRLKRLLGYFPI